MVVVLAVTHFEVFEHQLLAGLGTRGAAADRHQCRARARRGGRRIRIGRRSRCHHRPAEPETARTGRGRTMSRLRRAVCACAAGLALATFVGVGPRLGSRRAAEERSAARRSARHRPQHRSRLTFNEPVEISLGAIRLFDGTGASIDVSAARHPDGRDEAVEVDLPDADERLVRRRLAGGVQPTRTRCTPPSPSRSVRSRTSQSGLLDQIIGSSHTGKTASTGLTVSRSLVTASIAIVFGGLLACGLGIVPFGRRQRVVHRRVAARRRDGRRHWHCLSRSATRPGDRSASSPTGRRGEPCSTPRSVSPGSSAPSSSR